jgi:hypothetical protein
LIAHYRTVQEQSDFKSIRPALMWYDLQHARLEAVQLAMSEIQVHRSPRRKRLVREIKAWEKQRNDSSARVKWMFTTERARVKLARAYPNAEKESKPL